MNLPVLDDSAGPPPLLPFPLASVPAPTLIPARFRWGPTPVRDSLSDEPPRDRRQDRVAFHVACDGILAPDRRVGHPWGFDFAKVLVPTV